MPTEPDTPRLSEVVRRAVEIVDPDGVSGDLERYYLLFEDRDEPVTALLEGGRREFFEQLGRVAGQDPDPSLEMAAAVATYLVFRRSEVTDDDDDLLRLAGRAEYDGSPPPHIANWLALRGIEL